MRSLALLALVSLAFQPGCLTSDEAPTVAAAPSRRPPSRPVQVMPGERRWFVLSHVWLGLRDLATGRPSTDAWKDLGFDLDRRTTSREDSRISRSSCVRSGGDLNVLADGAEGVDNNFGARILPIVRSLKADAEESANSEMASGRYTLLLRIDGAVDGDNARAPGALFAAGPFDGTPSFAAEERWPVWSSAVQSGDIEKPVRTFPLGYVRDGVWVSGEIGEAPGPIWIPVIDGPVNFQASAVVTLDMRGGRGLIAGALPATELVRAADGWAAKFGTCSNDPTWTQASEILAHNSDLVIGASDLQDPARTCDAISFGIGFEARPVEAPVALVAPPPEPPSLRDCD